MELRLSTGTIDLPRATYQPHEGEAVHLTTREVALLTYLGEHAGDDVSRDDLLREVWGHHRLSMSRAVDTAVTRLRRKLEPDPRNPRSLCTVHGEGYRLVLARPNDTVMVAPSSRAGSLQLGERTVDLDAGRVHGPEQDLALTAQERLLLIALARRPGRLVDTARLRRLAGVTGGNKALSNAVYRLRAKLEPDPDEPRWLHTVRGHGYRLDVELTRPRSSLAKLQHTLWTMADTLGNTLGLEDCVVYARDGNYLVQTAAFGTKASTPGDVTDPIALRFGEGIVGTAAGRGRLEYVPDVRQDARYIEDIHPGRSELAVPIIRDAEVVGVLDSESTRLDAYDDRHRATFLSMARIAAAAVGDLGNALG